MGVWTLQNNMNRGELDPRLEGRKDLEAYYNGLATASNVVALPLGGIKKRPGMEYLGSTVYASDGSNARLETFSFSVDVNYLLVFTDLRMQVYKGGVLMTNLNGSGNDYIVTPWAIADVLEFDYIQSADTIIITHEDYQPRTIVRGSDTTWTLAALTLTNIPQYDFNDLSSPTPADCIQTVTINNTTPGDRFKLSLEGLLTDEIALGSATAEGATATATAIQNELLALRNTPNTGITVTGGYTTFYTFTVTFSGVAAKDWEAITGATVFSQSASFSINSVISSPGTSRAEDVWSSTRGWPRTCTFHEGRLYFGGSKSRPQTIWGSNVNDFFNFGTRKAYDDEAVSATLDTDQINTIQAIYSNRRLQVFTAGGEFYVPSSPVTPENIAVPLQSQYGSKRIRPVSIDGVTLFAQRTGKSIIQYVYLDEFQANQATSASILSNHLINDPVKMAVSRGSSDDDVNYVYIVNDAGNMIVFNTLSAQGVAGFTRWNSAPSAWSQIKSVTVVNGSVYLAVKRTINGSDVIQIEMQNNDLNTDAGVQLVGSHGSVTGLTHLEGESVAIKVDGANRAPQTVTSGEVTIDPVSTSTVEVGLQYTPLIQTMPLNVGLNNGPNAYLKKKILRVGLELYQSNGIIVQGQRIPDKTIGVNQFAQPLPYTGSRQIYLSGYTREAQVQITQDTPFGFTILNIGTEIKT